MENNFIKVGSGTKKFNDLSKVSLCLTDIPKEYIFEYNGKEYIKLDVKVFDKPNQFGKDVAVNVDTFKPEPKETPRQQLESVVNKIDDDIPF